MTKATCMKSDAVLLYGQDRLKLLPPPRVPLSKLKLESYDMRLVLKALAMYSPHNYRSMDTLGTLRRARKTYGTQFIIDLFIATETYIDHYPKYKIGQCRVDINTTLMTVPNHRILFEE